ncbi:MAG: hypothetical protein GY849_17840, partial [Deltaproteobacteria bacterium]|nr:hypothetical protein [Deltaproteobacteria bacterium]
MRYNRLGNNHQETDMSRCCYTHSSFRIKIGKAKNFLHDDTDQCWMSDVGNFGSGEEPKFYCVFHAPENEEPGNRGDWPVDERGKIQAKRLHGLLDEWNAENEGLKEPKAFLLPWLKCGVIKLHEYKFSGPIVFTSATFSGYANFDLATFSDYASFASATFSDTADFASAAFSGYANFDLATFSDYASFASATFSDTADFASATFSSTADFDSAAFSSYANFASATFSVRADFASAAFSGYANFTSATFSGAVDFASAIFSSTADFTLAAFSGYANFAPAIFSSTANFASATFSGTADFASAIFSGSTFNNSTFHSYTYFSNTHFKNAPEFYGATLHQATDFRGAKFIDRESRQAPPAYCTLKLAMSTVKAHQEAAWFYALEQESRRKQLNTPFRIKAFSFLYQWLSDYGRNFFRPLGWLAGMTAAFWW